MALRVYGTINGVGSIPIFAVGDAYYFEVPATLTGRYVCQFWVEDEFGNITNETAILYVEMGIIKCIEVLSRTWAVTMLRDPWTAEGYQDTYSLSACPQDTLTMEADGWTVKMVPITCRRNMMEVI